MTSQQNVRLIDDAGSGPALIILRGTDLPSKAVALLEKDFRVLSFLMEAGANVAEVSSQLANAIGSLKVTEAAIVANASAAPAALALAVAHPDLVKSVALLSPNGAMGDVSNLKAPVLALFGTADAGRSPDAAKAFCRSIPNCRLVYVYDAGLAVDDERPEAVAATLQDFAIRREGYLVNAKRGNLYP